eukprot:5591615-Amphidinium_carterae.1
MSTEFDHRLFQPSHELLSQFAVEFSEWVCKLPLSGDPKDLGRQLGFDCVLFGECLTKRAEVNENPSFTGRRVLLRQTVVQRLAISGATPTDI